MATQVKTQGKSKATTAVKKRGRGCAPGRRGSPLRSAALQKPRGTLEAALSDEDLVLTVKQYLRLHWEAMEEWFETEMRPKYKAKLKKRVRYSTIRSLSRNYAPIYVAQRRQRLVDMMLGVETDIEAQPIDWLRISIDCLEQHMTTLSSLNPDEMSDEDLSTISEIGKIVLKFRDQEIRREGLELYRDRLRAQITTKVQAGMDALYKAIKDNPKAVVAYEKMQELLAEGINSEVEAAPFTKNAKVSGSGRKKSS